MRKAYVKSRFTAINSVLVKLLHHCFPISWFFWISTTRIFDHCAIILYMHVFLVLLRSYNGTKMPAIREWHSNDFVKWQRNFSLIWDMRRSLLVLRRSLRRLALFQFELSCYRIQWSVAVFNCAKGQGCLWGNAPKYVVIVGIFYYWYVLLFSPMRHSGKTTMPVVYDEGWCMWRWNVSRQIIITCASAVPIQVAFIPDHFIFRFIRHLVW